jgi:hypothetical protein
MVAGHAAGVVRASAPPTPVAVRRPVHSQAYADYATFKEEANTAVWRARRRNVTKYLELRRSDAGRAERFLSSVFRARSAFTIALADGDGRALSPCDMVEALVEDYRSRADNDFPQDPEAALELTKQVSAIRQCGAASVAVHPWALSPEVSQGPDACDYYSECEVNSVLDSLNVHKKAIRGCYAAARAQVPGARALTRALLNLGRHVCLTATLWCLRQFAPIRKDGPRVVRSTSCLRPVSLAAVMASLQDALWTARNAPRLEAYCGAGQQGGVGDPICLLIALVLHTQLRNYQRLCTWWALADLRWAFDTADIPAMKVAVFLAGVCATDWLLLDDILEQDRQCVGLMGLR